MYEGYIYKIYNDINVNIYIGQTITTISARFSKHKNSARHQKDIYPIHRAMYKYGIDKFHIELIETVQAYTKKELIEILDKKEILYISKYNCRAPNGYNISAGGSGVKDIGCREVISYDPYTKEQYYYKSVDEASLNNNVPTSNIIACCQGKKYSINNKIYKYKEDGILEVDIDNYFKHHPIISQYDVFGNKLNSFISSIEAAKFLKNNNALQHSDSVIAKNIMACCNGNIQTAYKYVWRKMDDNFNKYSIKIDYPRNDKKYTEELIDVYTINGIFINSFANIKEAFKALNLDGKQTNQAIRCCRGKAAMAFDYIWRFKDEPFTKYSCAVINGNIRINKYTLNGEFIDTYMNYSHAARSVNTTNTQAIAICCKTGEHRYRDFLWFHINDDEQPDKTKIIR